MGQLTVNERDSLPVPSFLLSTVLQCNAMVGGIYIYIYSSTSSVSLRHSVCTHHEGARSQIAFSDFEIHDSDLVMGLLRQCVT